MIDEPEGVGDFPIAKQYCGVFAFRPNPVGLIQILMSLPRLLGRVERASEDAFVGRQPAQSDLRQHRNQFWTDGALRRPEAHGGTTECGGMKLDGALQLRLRIFRRMESRGEREIRSGASSEVCIDEERQDRVKEGGRRELDLFPLHQPSIERNDLPNGDELEGQHLDRKSVV